eukprot:CAMPEP_0172525512 /NCGR_PEP_ID=MMETSP1067-20121228/550_1 /TAXON_ID=265564 ORGANISM="Thalassiosira punctigera, Strain Tpunct2005C2" /NCGR_SAMPLE_ID=MMETSP1067 /ASSEMBLY_ACC=CAM_ASM_000444 /LENGTH=39 /DNA_ID= /DNA_START= /DNA_END= /DNA_ORIENTATION=
MKSLHLTLAATAAVLPLQVTAQAQCSCAPTAYDFELNFA